MENDWNVPEIALAGAPYDKGLAHGSACRAQVMRSLDTYRARFARKWRNPFSWDDARAAARAFAPALSGEFAPYAEEMRGIAAGAGIGFEDVLALNLRSEILYSGLEPGEPAPEGECTAFAAVPPATAGGAVLAGQTWDYSSAQRGATILARLPAEGGRPAVWMPLEAGMVGGKGVSAAGFCLTLNALSSPRKGGPACLAVTARDGRCAAFELDPDGAAELRPEGGVFVHTNHFVSPRYRSPDPPGGSTAARYDRLSALLRGRAGLSMADAERFLADHEEGRPSICVHPAPGTPPEDLPLASATNYAFVADLAAGRVRFVMGNPCQGVWRDIAF